ncbi:MAG: LptA/OstA family protein [Pseudohongiellaceae bacterium]
MNSLLQSKSFFLSVATTVLLSSVGQAADNSAEELRYSADGELTMTVADNVRTLNLSENVIITQGTLEIVGDLAILEFDEITQDLIRATIYGKPVSYTQILSDDNASVNGTSDSIVLLTEESTDTSVIELNGNAKIQSPDSSMQCAAIVYIPDNDLIRKATGPCAGLLNPSQDGDEE